jgi:nucleoside-diphosphate-sugar epimerase
MRKNILVLGGGGFIGGHAVKRFKNAGHWVRSVDLKAHEYGANPDEFLQGDLTEMDFVRTALFMDDEKFDEIYQFAADMGGAGYIFTGENDANVMYNSATINLNVVKAVLEFKNNHPNFKPKIFYSSSACIYPAEIQTETVSPDLREEHAYPANPDSEYGWEKLFSERLFLAFNRNFDFDVRIARFHNIFGPEGTWTGGKEKSPAAICRKVAEASDGGSIEVWGDGLQTRSFLYVTECLDAVEKLMESDFTGPINIGSEEMVTINQMVEMVAGIAGKEIEINHIDGPTGVRGRNSNNDLIRQKLNWDYNQPLKLGLQTTFEWILSQIERKGERS